MELMTKQGYKQTEVGLIPEDWNVSSLDEMTKNGALIRGPFGGALKKEFFVREGWKVYEQRNAIYQSVELGRYFIDESKFKELKRFEIKEGDFILSCSGTIGRIFKIPKNFKKGIINQALLIIRLDNNKVFSNYFYYQFINETFQSKVIDDTQGGAMKNLIGMSDFKKASIPVPPTLNEQKAIATALSDVDALITSLEQTITKKKAIKQGAMQQLLTPPHKGGKRLPGFEGEWVEKTLGNICSYQNGKALENYFNNKEGYKVISIGNYSESGKYVHNNSFISKSFKSEIGKFVMNKGELAMLLNDKTPTGTIIGRVLFIDRDNEFVFNQRTMRLKPKEVFDAKFLYHLLNSDLVHNQIYLKAKPGTQIYINTIDVLELIIDIPQTQQEQKAIAQILSDMDAEITQLETKKEKYQAIKQGMMQELLTGKTRLL